MTDRRAPGGMFETGGAPASRDAPGAAVADAPPAADHVLVLTPRDVADLAQIVRDAAAAGTPLRLRGGGSWLDAGHPVDAAATLDLSLLQGVVEYTPGDLTLTAGAATTLAELDSLTRANGQWLPLDAAGSARATLGATLATASRGPLAASIGLPRDLALGLTFVRGDGVVAHGGGRVVKNVAGFDLVRLMVGAWGTLGVLTQATVRLRALPETEATIALALPAATADLAPALRALREAPLAPLAMELVDARLARRLGLGDRPLALVRIAGNGDSVAAQRATLAALGESREADAGAWQGLRAGDPPAAATCRVARRPSELATLWAAVQTALAEAHDATAHASIEHGVVRVIVPRGHAPIAPLVAALSQAGRLVAERLPAEGWSGIPADTADRLSAGIRRAFDPARILNPGILGET